MTRRVEVGPQLISSTSPYFHDIVSWAWRRARELATRMGSSVETLRPDHLYGEEAQNIGYMLKVGEIYPGNVLPERTYLVIYGIFNTDETLDYVQISDGRRTYDWYVLPVLYFTERIAVWGEGPIVLDAYSTKLVVHSLDPNRDRVYAWLLGFVIKPRQQQSQEVSTERRRRRR